MSERDVIAGIYRRVAFGVTPGELDRLEALGIDGVIDRLVDPDAHGVDAAPVDLWAGLELPPLDSYGQALAINGRWFDALIVTPRPFHEWMAWYWHGHLVSGLNGAFAVEMIVQLNLFRRSGLGSFADLLRAVTVGAAMLRYLDGDQNEGTNPNENYSREVLELFALGIGNYTQDDIVAGARALSGWRIDLLSGPSPSDPARPRVYFDPSRHNDAPQRYLGRADVHDVDTVVDAIVNHEACAPFVASRFGRAVLGPEADPGLLADLGRRFQDADLNLSVLSRAVLEALAEGHGTGLLLAPMPWLVAAQRATGAILSDDYRSSSLFASGQFPLFPPNVVGWPGGRQWLASSAITERFNLASALASAAPPTNTAKQAAAEGDLPALADALGHPAGFSQPTTAALEELRRSVGLRDGVELLAVALASPDLVMA